MNTAGAIRVVHSITEENKEEQLVVGQVVEGVITNVSDTISINLNGKELQVSQSAVQNAKEGQVRTFEIKESSKESIVLREVGMDTEEGSQHGVQKTSVVTVRVTVSKETKDEESKECLDAAKEKLKKQIASTLQRFTKEDYVESEKEATPMENYTEERMERMLDRVKEQRQFKSVHLESQIEKKQEQREELAEATKGIKERLEEEQLPATDANIAKVATTMELAAMAAQMTDASKAYLIDQQLPITPENLYKSVYSTSVARSAPLSDSAWQQLQPKVEELLQQDGMDVTEEAVTDAKWLIEHGLVVDKDNVETVGLLNALQKGEEPSQWMELSIRQLAQGGEPKQTDLVEMREQVACLAQAKASMEMLEGITDDAVEKLEEGDEVTIQALYAASSQAGTKQRTDIQVITARRQLEEIRLKLTMESSYHLYRQGINVNTTALSDLVEHLKTLEDNYYKGLCEELTGTANQNEVSMLKTTTQVVEGLKGMPATVLGSTFPRRTSINIVELLEEAEFKKNAFDKASEYETLMTAPRKELGDSIKKAFTKVDGILEDLGMEQSASNERAVRILAYNEMEITKESITQMKHYDLQVNQVMRAMTPEVCLALIKEGKNPLDLPVAEVSELARETSEALGETSEEKFSKFLYELDRKKEITSEQRESYLGIYRLLHQVEKSDGAAVGAVVKADKELTLGNLLTEVRSRNSQGMDIVVDDTVGEVIQTKRAGASITEQIGAAFYEKDLAGEVAKGISPDALMNAEAKQGGLSSVTLECLYEEELGAKNESATEWQISRYEQMREVFETTTKSDVLLCTGIDITANNLAAAEQLLAENSNFYGGLKDFVKIAGADMKEQLEQTYAKMYAKIFDRFAVEEEFDRMTEVLEKATEGYLEKSGAATAENVSKVSFYRNGIHLAKELSKREVFEVPVLVNDEVVSLKVQMTSTNDESSKVSIHMENESLGAFDVTATVEDGMLSAMVLCESRKVMDYYEGNKENICKQLEQTGIRVKQLVATMNRKKTGFYETSERRPEKVSSEVLYQVAKVFVASTKRALE